MYDAASSASSKLSEFILNGDWNFLNPTCANLRGIIQELPPIGTSDYVVWAPQETLVLVVLRQRMLLGIMVRG